MGVFSFLVLVILYCEVSSRNEAFRKRDRWVSEQIEKRNSDMQDFKMKFGASDEEVRDAIYKEQSKHCLAEEIRDRLITEAGVDSSKYKDSFVHMCHFIALGILAQSGRIPIDFIDNGIDWSRECALIRSHDKSRRSEIIEMVERFVYWYDKELVDHGISEHMVMSNPDVRLLDVVSDAVYSNQIQKVKTMDHLYMGGIIFWPSTRIHTGLPGSFRRISRRLIK